MKPTSSKNNPILNRTRELLARNVGFALGALAYEGCFGCREFVNYGYNALDVLGVTATRDQVEQAWIVYSRIVRVENSGLQPAV